MPALPTATIADILAVGPCWSTRRVRNACARAETFDAIDVLDAWHITAPARLWTLKYVEHLVTVQQMRRAALVHAQTALQAVRVVGRVSALASALEAQDKYLRQEASELDVVNASHAMMLAHRSLAYDLRVRALRSWLLVDRAFSRAFIATDNRWHSRDLLDRMAAMEGPKRATTVLTALRKVLVEDRDKEVEEAPHA